jgi:hypothetical protein
MSHEPQAILPAIKKGRSITELDARCYGAGTAGR